VTRWKTVSTRSNAGRAGRCDNRPRSFSRFRRARFIQDPAQLPLLTFSEWRRSRCLRLEQCTEEDAVILLGAYGAEVPGVGLVAYMLGLKHFGFAGTASLAETQKNPQGDFRTLFLKRTRREPQVAATHAKECSVTRLGSLRIPGRIARVCYQEALAGPVSCHDPEVGGAIQGRCALEDDIPAVRRNAESARGVFRE
jgi:hypothetical protein